MKHAGTVLICLAGGLALQTARCANNSADTAGNPYAGIVDRNVFALKPAPPPPVAPPTADQLPQKIVLTGIVKAFGKKQVFFKTPMAAKPGEAPKETSFMLSEGERAGEIEILEINEALASIRVRNHGLEQPLSLEKDGMKPQGGGPGAVPGALPMAAGAMPGGALTPVPTLGGSGAASVQRPLRMIPPQSASPSQGFNSPQGFGSSQGGNIPVQPKVLTPEEQIVHMEINRTLTADQVARGEMPPLPPTQFTPPPPSPQGQ